MEAVWEFIVQKHMLVTVQWFHRLENGKCRKIGTESVYDAQRCDFIRSEQLSSSVCCTVICCTPSDTKFFSISHAIAYVYTPCYHWNSHISTIWRFAHFPLFLSFSRLIHYVIRTVLNMMGKSSSNRNVQFNRDYQSERLVFRIFVRALFSILSKYPSVNEWIARFFELNLAKDFFLFWIFNELDKIFWCFALNWINKKK